MLSVRKFPDKKTQNPNENLFPKKMSCIAVSALPQPKPLQTEAGGNVLDLGHLVSDLFMLFGQLANC